MCVFFRAPSVGPRVPVEYVQAVIGYRGQEGQHCAGSTLTGTSRCDLEVASASFAGSIAQIETKPHTHIYTHTAAHSSKESHSKVALL